MKLSTSVTKELNQYLSKAKVNYFQLILDKNPHKDSKILLEFCIMHCIYKNQGKFRKTTGPRVIHPLNIAITCIRFNLDLSCVCTALFHDIVEDAVDDEIKSKNITSSQEKSNLRSKLRKNYFEELEKSFNNLIKYHNLNKKTQKEILAILSMIDILTRYSKSNESYYSYISKSFGKKIPYSKNIVNNSLSIKLLDRLDNITSMDTNVRKLLNHKLTLDKKIMNNLDEITRKKYLKLLLSQKKLLLDSSFSGENRLNQIWKNIFILFYSRLSHLKYKTLPLTPVSINIESTLIRRTLNVAKEHLIDLECQLKQSEVSLWLEQIKIFKEKGGLKSRTKTTLTKIPSDKKYLEFNKTFETFSNLLTKSHNDYARIKIDLNMQFKFTLVCVELLKEFRNKDYICDLDVVKILN